MLCLGVHHSGADVRAKTSSVGLSLGVWQSSSVDFPMTIMGLSGEHFPNKTNIHWKQCSWLRGRWIIDSDSTHLKSRLKTDSSDFQFFDLPEMGRKFISFPHPYHPLIRSFSSAIIGRSSCQWLTALSTSLPLWGYPIETLPVGSSACGVFLDSFWIDLWDLQEWSHKYFNDFPIEQKITTS